MASYGGGGMQGAHHLAPVDAPLQHGGAARDEVPSSRQLQSGRVRRDAEVLAQRLERAADAVAHVAMLSLILLAGQQRGDGRLVGCLGGAAGTRAGDGLRPDAPPAAAKEAFGRRADEGAVIAELEGEMEAVRGGRLELLEYASRIETL